VILFDPKSGNAGTVPAPGLLTVRGVAVKPPVAFLVVGARAQRPHEIDDALAHFRIGDLDESAVKLESLATVEKF
jgi:hypothetical protein